MRLGMPLGKVRDHRPARCGDRDQADDHRAHLPQNRSQNQAFEGDCLNHLSRLLDRPIPDFLALSLADQQSGRRYYEEQLNQASCLNLSWASAFETRA
jgi:hypothetical protein